MLPDLPDTRRRRWLDSPSLSSWRASRLPSPTRSGSSSLCTTHSGELTGIGNRRRFTRDLERAFDDAADVTLALFDLDGFKLYNDTFGHLAGDALLVRIAARFAAVVGPDRAYRIGGDEFCTLLPL